MDAESILELERNVDARIRDIQPSIPEHMIEGLVRHVVHGCPSGSFLTAILSNDFMEAASRVDVNNMASFQAWAHTLYNAVPSGCYGSPETVAAWIKQGGMVGLSQSEKEQDYAS